MKIKNILLILLVIAFGCKDEFLLDSYNYSSQLVVEGLISNEQGPYTIKITLASPINNTAEIPVEGCSVTIYENANKSEILTETEPGIYVTSSGGIQGVIGNSYSISIVTQDGKEYMTEYQLMKESVGIESIDAEMTYQEVKDFSFPVAGYKFRMSSEIAPTQDNYFLWRLTETYEYKNDFKLDHFFIGVEEIYYEDTSIIQEITNDTLLDYYNSTLFTCWKNQQVNYFYTGMTSNLSIPKITNQSLHFVSTESKRLSQRYSLLLKQYSINEEAFYYWEGVEKQSSNKNFLVSSQPYSIIGNIKNVNDPNDLVLGYFTVASVTQKRIFVNRLNEEFYYPTCSPITDPDAISEALKTRKLPYFYIQTGEGPGLIYESCIDCRSDGGIIKKPDFWIDK